MTDDDGYVSPPRVPEEALERAREQKEAAGRTWGEQIVRPPADADDVDGTNPDVVAEQVVDLLAAEGYAFDDEFASKVADEVEERLR